ncbi:MAG: ABC transporter permease [Nocardioides sp.]|nr:ABC transporter permease [Nocardioides sp.]
MWGFIVRRLLLGILVLFLVSVIVFAGTQALGDPARAILGRDATPDRLAALQAQLHLDQNVVGQYVQWLSGLLHGSFGTSLASQQPVSQLLGPRLVSSIVLVVISAVISIPLSIVIGSYAALHREKKFDTIVSNVMLGLASMPEFVTALLLVILFSTNIFHALPSISPVPPGHRAWEYPDELILPVATLVIAVTPYVSRIMRASMIEVLESDYVEMARLKGLSERTVLYRHALPNAIGPVFQVTAISLAYLAGGIVIIEYVFNYPGIGSALVDAVTNHDIPVVQALAVLIAGLYVVLNLLADVATILVTPRLRTRL